MAEAPAPIAVDNFAPGEGTVEEAKNTAAEDAEERARIEASVVALERKLAALEDKDAIAQVTEAAARMDYQASQLEQRLVALEDAPAGSKAMETAAQIDNYASTLEQRLASLEEQVEPPKIAARIDDRASKLEQRLAALEDAPAGSKAIEVAAKIDNYASTLEQRLAKLEQQVLPPDVEENLSNLEDKSSNLDKMTASLDERMALLEQTSPSGGEQTSPSGGNGKSCEQMQLRPVAQVDARVAELDTYAQQLMARLSVIEKVPAPNTMVSVSKVDQVDTRTSELHKYVQQLLSRLSVLENAPVTKSGDEISQGPVSKVSNVDARVAEMDTYVKQLLARLAALETAPGTALASNADAGQALRWDSKRTELDAYSQQLLDRLVALESAGRSAAQVPQVPRSVHEDLLRKMTMLEDEYTKLQNSPQGVPVAEHESLRSELRAVQGLQQDREAQQLSEMASMQADSQELRQQLEVAVTLEEYKLLEQDLQARTLEYEALKQAGVVQGAAPAECDALRQQLHDSRGDYAALQLQLEAQVNPQVHAELQQHLEALTVEFEVLKRGSAQSVPVQEYEALNLQLQARVSPEEHDVVKQRLGALVADYEELQNSIAATEQQLRMSVPTSEYEAVQKELLAQQKSHALVCDQNEVLKIRLQQAPASSGEDQVALRQELDAITAERNVLRQENTQLTSAASESQKNAMAGVSILREEHEALKEQLKQSVAQEEYGALKDKYALLQQDLMKTASETQNLRQTFQERLNEANQAVAEATKLLGTDYSNVSRGTAAIAPAPLPLAITHRKGSQGSRIKDGHQGPILGTSDTIVLSRNGSPPPLAVQSGPARENRTRSPSALSQGGTTPLATVAYGMQGGTTALANVHGEGSLKIGGPLAAPVATTLSTSIAAPASLGNRIHIPVKTTYGPAGGITTTTGGANYSRSTQAASSSLGTSTYSSVGASSYRNQAAPLGAGPQRTRGIVTTAPAKPTQKGVVVSSISSPTKTSLIGSSSSLQKGIPKVTSLSG